MRTYIAYKGDEVVAMGTLSEVAKKLGVQEATVIWYSQPCARRRCKTVVEVVDDQS